ncbi:MAG TPA: hypothetical protein VGE01_05545 [Fimbriimonas sp.]
MAKLSVYHLLAAAISISAPALGSLFRETPSKPAARPVSSVARPVAVKKAKVRLVDWVPPHSKPRIPM